MTKVEWKSPHAWIYVDVTNDKGEKVNWQLRTAEPQYLDAPGMDAGFVETRRPRQSDRRSSPQLSGHRHRHLHQGWQRQALVYRRHGDLRTGSGVQRIPVGYDEGTCAFKEACWWWQRCSRHPRVPDVGGVRHIYMLTVRGTTVTGIYCTDCNNLGTLAIIENGRLGADNLRFDVHNPGPPGTPIR